MLEFINFYKQVAGFIVIDDIDFNFAWESMILIDFNLGIWLGVTL